MQQRDYTAAIGCGRQRGIGINISDDKHFQSSARDTVAVRPHVPLSSVTSEFPSDSYARKTPCRKQSAQNGRQAGIV